MGSSLRLCCPANNFSQPEIEQLATTNDQRGTNNGGLALLVVGCSFLLFADEIEQLAISNQQDSEQQGRND
jgi:hypothetical protein